MNTEDIPKATPIEEEECEVDDLYYFDLVIFKVENKLFRVPKVGFNVEGTPFEAMFTLPHSAPVEGSTDKNPIILQGEGITKANFRAFLRVLYPITDAPLTHEELGGAMELAIMWNFTKLRTRLVQDQEMSMFVQTLHVHQRILYAKQCKAKRWLLDAYGDVIKDDNISNVLGLLSQGVDGVTVAKLFYVREETVQQATVSCRKCCPKRLSSTEITQRIQEVFDSEFQDMEF